MARLTALWASLMRWLQFEDEAPAFLDAKPAVPDAEVDPHAISDPTEPWSSRCDACGRTFVIWNPGAYLDDEPGWTYLKPNGLYHHVCDCGDETLWSVDCDLARVVCLTIHSRMARPRKRMNGKVITLPILPEG